MTHFLSFDVEHWYLGYRSRNIQGWDQFPGRDHLIVENLLALLDEYQVKATFFTTGMFAEEFSTLIQKIAERGHEIASHSYSHTMVTSFPSLAAFSLDLQRSLTVLRSIVGDDIIGFRAPKWSIPKDNLDSYYQILVDNGLKYDSSLYPMGHEPQVHRYPFCVHGIREFWQIPAGTFSLAGINIPAAGGLWLRLWPAAVSMSALRQAEKQKQPSCVYLHPYDLDYDCPQISVGFNLKRRLFTLARHYRLRSTEPVLRSLLREFRFGPMRQWLVSN